MPRTRRMNKSNMTSDLNALLPHTKHDVDNASTLVLMGYPAIEHVLPQMLEWLQDLNWPVAAIFQPFFVSVGRPLAPHIRSVLAGDDDAWKYNLLIAVVARSPELANALRPELERIASRPTDGELLEEVSLEAAEILIAI